MDLGGPVVLDVSTERPHVELAHGDGRGMPGVRWHRLRCSARDCLGHYTEPLNSPSSRPSAKSNPSGHGQAGAGSVAGSTQHN